LTDKSDKNHHNTQVHLQPVDNQRLALLCGHENTHIKSIEASLGVAISQRSHLFTISGPETKVAEADRVLRALYHDTVQSDKFTIKQVQLQLQQGRQSMATQTIHTDRVNILARGDNQTTYVQNIHHYDINFGIGPAGTGKTYLAVACAVEALNKGLVQRIILVRPAVEAGEFLGFLPGDMAEKVLPYLRPLYDALYEMCGVDKITKLMETDVIEIAPLAFMRGRTLSDAFIILDEGQNATIDQMKMFLTRLGHGSTAVITGDVTQIDLAKAKPSGLIHAEKVLKNVPNISFTHFEAKDTVRHSLVQAIIQAYQDYEDPKD
jgi:phosphate starvation-inducible PhoH-like protein